MLQYAAAVSFSTLFSIAPVTIIAVTVSGFFFGEETAARELEKQIAGLMGPASVELVQAAVRATEATRTSTWSTIAGAALMIFGAAGSLVALLIWIYYSCAILFYGAELIRAYGAAHHRPVVPKETAVLVQETVVTEKPRRRSR